MVEARWPAGPAALPTGMAAPRWLVRNSGTVAALEPRSPKPSSGKSQWPMDVIRIFGAILLPPLGTRCSASVSADHFWLNIPLTLPSAVFSGSCTRSGHRQAHRRERVWRATTSAPATTSSAGSSAPRASSARGGNRPAACGAPRVLAGRPLPHTRDAAAHGPRRPARPDPGHRRHRDRADRAYIVLEAARLGVPKGTLARMIANVGIDFIVGLVPLLGDLGDFAWKANRRNARMLRDHLLARRGKAPAPIPESPRRIARPGS